MHVLRRVRLAGAVSVWLLSLAACFGGALGEQSGLSGESGEGGGLDNGNGDGSIPGVGPQGQGDAGGTLNPNALINANFEALSPGQGASRVKSLLTGLALTDDEYVKLSADANALGPMVDAWLATPQWRKVMFDYFRSVFQTGTNNMFDWANDFIAIFQINQDWTWFGWHTWYDIITSLQDSFPRTVLALIDEGRPFTEVVTTQRYMLNVPTMTMMAYFDSMPRDKRNGVIKDALWIPKAYPNASYTRQATRKVAYEDSMNPASPDFMTWYDPIYNEPNPATPKSAYNYGWTNEPLTFAWDGTNSTPLGNMASWTASDQVMMGLFGGRCRMSPWKLNTSTTPGRAGVFTDADWADWKMVSVRKPKAGEQPSLFMNVPALRASNELVLYGDMAGFITTLGFLEQWPTNLSNQDRLLVNQALIIGLDYTLAPQASTSTAATPSDPNMHSVPGSPCFGCHQVLDPMVDLFHASYEYSHRRQVDPNVMAKAGSFSVPGADPTGGTGVVALGAAMAAHPSFATGWVQKMCRFANSAECNLQDPEFLRVVDVFVQSNYDFKKMLKALVTSPIVTYAAPTYSTLAADGVSILRREQFCSVLEARLQWPDVCQQRTHNIFEGTADADDDAYTNNIRALANTVAPTSFVRGHTAPAMPQTPDLFFVEGTQHLCQQVAIQMVDRKAQVSLGASFPSARSWSSTNSKDAVTDFVAVLMGIPPSDPRNAGLAAALNQHVADAVAGGASATDALRSAFTAACVSSATVTRGL